MILFYFIFFVNTTKMTHLLYSQSIRPYSPLLVPGTFTSKASRTNTTKKVTLTQGHLVLECPVPSRLMEMSARKDKEFSTMRYTAVTCDPDQFEANHYTLRPQLMNRSTELFIVITMYNVLKCLFSFFDYINHMIGR